VPYTLFCLSQKNLSRYVTI